jgi:hypothetical protein
VLWYLTTKTEGTRLDSVGLPAFDSRTVYLFRARDHLEARDARTGAVRWQADVRQGPMTVRDRILVTGPGRLTALSRSGAVLWAVSTPTGGAAAATVVRDRVYLRVQGSIDGDACSD